MDQVLAALHHGNPRRLPLTLAFARVAGEVTLCCRFPDSLRAIIEGQLYAQYPDAKLTLLPDGTLDPNAEQDTCRALQLDWKLDHLYSHLKQLAGEP